MIESLCEEQGLSLRLNQQWLKYIKLGVPFVVDVNVQITKDRNTWEDFFKRFNKQDLKIVPNQNLSELINQFIYQQQLDVSTILRQLIKGRLVIHCNDKMEFPDDNPIICQDEPGLTHHIIIEYDNEDLIPHRLICYRKEKYQLLGDYYELKDKNQIQVVKQNYTQYFKIIKEHTQKNNQMTKRQINTEMNQQQITEEDWQQLAQTIQQEQQREKETTALQEELQIQQTMGVHEIQRLQLNSQKIRLKNKQRERSREREIQKEKQIVQSEQVSSEGSSIGQEIKQKKNIKDWYQFIVFQKQNILMEDVMMQSFLVRGFNTFSKHVVRLLQIGQQFIMEKGDKYLKTWKQIEEKYMFQPFMFTKQPENVNIAVSSLFIWNYRGMYFDFTQYMISIEPKTDTWNFITDHYAATWYSTKIKASNKEKLTEEYEKVYYEIDRDKYQNLWYRELESKWLTSIDQPNAIFKLLDQQSLTQELNELIKIYSKNGNRICLEENALTEYSNLTLIYNIASNKEITPIYVFWEIKATQSHMGKFLIMKKNDIVKYQQKATQYIQELHH